MFSTWPDLIRSTPRRNTAGFRRESAKYGRIWNLKVDVSDLGAAAPPPESWLVETSGPNWHTQTKVELLDWQDIVRAEISRPAIVQVLKGLVTFADFVFSGTAKRYFELFWPYALFFLTPYFHVFANIAISTTLGIIASGYVTNDVAAIATFLATFCVSFAHSVPMARRSLSRASRAGGLEFRA